MPACWLRGHRPSYHEPVAKIAGKVPLQLCKSCGVLYSESKVKFRAQKVKIGVLTPNNTIRFDYNLLPDPKFMPVVVVRFILDNKEIVSCYNPIDDSVNSIIVEDDENSLGFVLNIGPNGMENQSALLFSKYKLGDKTRRFSRISRYTRRVVKKFKKSIAKQLDELPTDYVVGVDMAHNSMVTTSSGWLVKSGVGVNIKPLDAHSVRITNGADDLVEFPSQLTDIDEQIID